jgi:CrcB protein
MNSAFSNDSAGQLRQLFLVVGFLGGFTTFSAFSLEVFVLLKSSQIFIAVVYILSSVVLGLLATSLGYYLAS